MTWKMKGHNLGQKIYLTLKDDATGGNHYTASSNLANYHDHCDFIPSKPARDCSAWNEDTAEGR